MNYNLPAGIVLFIAMHILVWISSNVQFMGEAWRSRALPIAVALSLPTTLASYYGSRCLYYGLGSSAWSVRFVAFGLSWLVFPLMTWILLRESPFSAKTLASLFLAGLIVTIQLSWRSPS